MFVMNAILGMGEVRGTDTVIDFFIFVLTTRPMSAWPLSRYFSSLCSFLASAILAASRAFWRRGGMSSATSKTLPLLLTVSWGEAILESKA